MSRARDLSKLVNPSLFSIDTSNNLGVNSTSPDAKLDVAGIVSATSFYGDGSNLEGVASAGLGTALGEEGGLEVIYYTDNVLTIGSTITVDPPASTNVAYTQYAEIAVSGDADLIVADGDDLVPDILGLSTEGVTPISGAGGRVRADSFTNHAGNGAPTFPNGVNITGVVTATSLSGNLTGNVTGNVTGTAATFSGDVSVGGTLTYQDVTNVDSVGLITARSGISVGAGQSVGSNSGTVTYYGDGQYLTGISVGITTTSSSPSADTVVLLDLNSAQHHELSLTAGITTISCTGGSFGDSHSVVLVQPTTGIATVGFSTYFLFPSGADPSMSEGGGKIDLLSFVVRRVGATGIGTELLASAGLNYQ